MSTQAATTTDGYKIGHIDQYQPGTTRVVSNWTPRKSRIKGIDKVVFFGQQYLIKKWYMEEFTNTFFSLPKDVAIKKYFRRINNYLPPGSRVETKHIAALWDLQFLPITIYSLPEGASSLIRVPQSVVYNSEGYENFYWIVNYLETVASCTVWKPSTSATVSKEYRKIFEKYAMETVGDTGFVPFQGHDFSMRGMSGVEDACASGAGHLLNFVGTDTIPAIDWLEKYYNADCEKELIGCSVAATEHAVMCSGTGFYIWDKHNGDWSFQGKAELDVFKRLITEVYPTGIVSIVSDTWDLWKVITEYLVELKDVVLARDGKLVIRPDSGDPVEILCGIQIEEIVASTYKEFLANVKETLHEELLEQTPHGEHGGDASRHFKWISKASAPLGVNKIYKATYSPEWNRHDKQYYYIDSYGDDTISAVEVELTPAQTGVVELLWNNFGGTVTKMGYKLLDSHIGTIYGDSITLMRASDICKRLKDKGFASINWVAGIGSYTYQMQTRDTFGFAQKSTYCEVEVNFLATPESVEYGTKTYHIDIFKDPITDDGTKKSARGITAVFQDANGEYYLKDQATWEELENCAFIKVFENGVLLKDFTLQEIRDNIRKEVTLPILQDELEKI